MKAFLMYRDRNVYPDRLLIRRENALRRSKSATDQSLDLQCLTLCRRGREEELLEFLCPLSDRHTSPVGRGAAQTEGSEIAEQITTALVDSGIKVFFVTHLYTFPPGVC